MHTSAPSTRTATISSPTFLSRSRDTENFSRNLNNTNMKVIILGAGYGTRLETDLRNDRSGEFTHLIGIPKPLLPIGNLPLITHWMREMQNLQQIDRVFVVTNSVTHHLFSRWAEDWPKVQLVCDGSTSNETRAGAISAMNLAAQQFDYEDDVIVLAGDTLFYEDFSLRTVVQQFQTCQQREPHASMLVYVRCTDENVHKYGILETDDCNRVVGFVEKPQPEETLSRKACPCFYLLSKHSLPLVNQFLIEKKDEDIKARDAPGNFIKYLFTRMPVYATEISGRFDVGGLHTYIQCHEYFLNR